MQHWIEQHASNDVCNLHPRLRRLISLVHLSQCGLILQVATLKTGEIDCSDLKVHLLRNKGKPAILNVNIGTTVKGAVDDLDQVSLLVSYVGLAHLSISTTNATVVIAF